ncbi:MAG: hypothetical protein LUG18_12765 [Candidatus Azobacteroides sp.]|nr:hypothetical protein [Candidatus Azobacteroides sp.]
MKIAFTICSNNYLSQAKTLGDSLITHNPDYKFVIGLCDTKNDSIDYSFFSPHEILEVKNIGIQNLGWMINNYNIIELNTAAKPFYLQYFCATYPDLDMAFYFDPDIYIYNSFSYLEKELEQNQILLTPHITSPIPFDSLFPGENLFLNYGIYNLGFIGIKPSEEVDKMLSWWAERLATDCFINACEGKFVDQLPMNFVPIFYNHVKILKHLGLNMAYWNLHERTLGLKDNEYTVNEEYPLIFFHFSSLKPDKPFAPISPLFRTKNMEAIPYLSTLMKEYAAVLLKNKYSELRTISCTYIIQRQEYLKKQLQQEPFIKRMARKVKKAAPSFFNNMISSYAKLS